MFLWWTGSERGCRKFNILHEFKMNSGEKNTAQIEKTKKFNFPLSKSTLSFLTQKILFSSADELFSPFFSLQLT